MPEARLHYSFHNIWGYIGARGDTCIVPMKLCVFSGVKNDIHVFRFGRGLTSLSGDSNDTEPVVYGWER